MKKIVKRALVDKIQSIKDRIRYLTDGNRDYLNEIRLLEKYKKAFDKSIQKHEKELKELQQALKQ